MDSCPGLLAKLDAGMDDVNKSETKDMLQNKERSLMESKAKRDQVRRQKQVFKIFSYLLNCHG